VLPSLGYTMVAEREKGNKEKMQKELVRSGFFSQEVKFFFLKLVSIIALIRSPFFGNDARFASARFAFVHLNVFIPHLKDFFVQLRFNQSPKRKPTAINYPFG
jgi:hypothetical protein